MVLPETKKCIGPCGLTLPAKRFILNKGYLNPKCRTCQSEYVKGWQKTHRKNVEAARRKQYRRNRKFVLDYLSTHPCVDCPEFDTVCLDFDHVRGHKIAAIAQMVAWGYSLSRIKVEIEKCEVRCANCHRKITAKRRRKSKYL